MKRTHWFYNFRHHYSSFERIAIRWLSMNMKLFPLRMKSKRINGWTDRQMQPKWIVASPQQTVNVCEWSRGSPAHTWPREWHHLPLCLYTPGPSCPLTNQQPELSFRSLNSRMSCSAVFPEPSDDSSLLTQINTLNCSRNLCVGAHRVRPPTVTPLTSNSYPSLQPFQIPRCPCSFLVFTC